MEAHFAACMCRPKFLFLLTVPFKKDAVTDKKSGEVSRVTITTGVYATVYMQDKTKQTEGLLAHWQKGGGEE